MARNTLKRVMLGYILIDNETGAVFDRGPHDREWSLVINKSLADTLRDWGGKAAIVGQNVVFK